MPSHPVPHPDLAGYLLGILDLQETERFAAHLAGCDHCPAELADLGGLPALLAASGAGVQLPADLQARTFARIHTSAPAAAHPGGDGQLAGRRARRAPRRGWLLVAAAAVVVLLGAVGVATFLRSCRPEAARGAATASPWLWSPPMVAARTGWPTCTTPRPGE